MRVFVTGTGRCGTVSFRKACTYATNYKTGHESLCGLLEYPDEFIEVNPQLRHCIIYLAKKYPEAKWVHLIRNPETCIPSLARLNGGRVMEAYRILHNSVMPSLEPIDTAFRYYWCVRDIIDCQLRMTVHPECRKDMHLESIKEEWPSFWEWIEAKGNLEESLASWDTPNNTAIQRGEI